MTDIWHINMWYLFISQVGRERGGGEEEEEKELVVIVYFVY